MIEADFLREYRIDLVKALRDDSFSWRRFLSLLRGLSPQSAYANHIAAEAREGGGGGGKPKRVISDGEQAERYLLSLVG